VSAFPWERHPDGPFATLIAVAASYCTPEAYDGAYGDLINRARAPEPDEEIRAFRPELQQALADPGQLSADELFDAVDYDDGSDEAFLRRAQGPSGAPGTGISHSDAVPLGRADRLRLAPDRRPGSTVHHR
jgi:hypothetical protein